MSNMNMQQQANPLSKYFRQPKLFAALPSNGKFYPADSLETTETGEYAIYSMTAKDELTMKTPDALLNGQATVELIKSCVGQRQQAMRFGWRRRFVKLLEVVGFLSFVKLCLSSQNILK